MGAEALAADLADLRALLVKVRFPLDLAEAAGLRRQCRGAVDQLDDYLLPRLARLDAPLLAVIGGSTGAGKSTLLNSLLRKDLSPPGVIRPTTRSPVLVHHSDDRAWFASDAVLPSLARSVRTASDARTLQLVPEPVLPTGLALLDAPDVDSVVAENRVLAAQLLAAADLWLFVTTAARYADAVPWDYLRAAAERRAVVAVVLDRVPPAAMDEVPVHLGQMMSQRGLGSSPLFAVPETEVDAVGLLPDAAVAPIRDWLSELAVDASSRRAVALATFKGAVEALTRELPRLAEGVQAQVDSLTSLATDAENTFAEAVRTAQTQAADGSLLRGEVLARWQDFVGTGDFFRVVEQRIGRIRDRLVATFRGEPKQALEVKVAVESGLELLLRQQAEAAAARVESAWLSHPAGRQVLALSSLDLGRASTGFAELVGRAIREWQSDVLDLVSEVGASKKTRARFWALGVNGIGVALMILVFSQTGGLAGAELGVAGGAALLSQRVLEAVFGDDAVRRLAKQAKADLDTRIEVLLAGELTRYLSVLELIQVDPAQPELLRGLAERIAAASQELQAEAIPAEAEAGES